MQPDVLVCNLGRLGDIVQTQPVMSDLRNAGYQPALLCLKQFAPAAELLRDTVRIYELPGRDLLQTTATDWPEALRQLTGFVHEIQASTRLRWIVNLTPAIPARLLTSLIGQHRVPIAGFTLDDSLEPKNSGAWATFLALGGWSRQYASINLGDIQRRMLAPLGTKMNGSAALAPTDVSAQVDRALANVDQRKLVAMQLGASHPARQWPVERFRELGSKLAEAGYLPVLVGGPADKPLAEEYCKGTTHQFLDCIGETSIPVLAELLRRCELLVTNDTGVMHVAAGTGTPILAIFLATAQAWDTGPQSEDALCLQPALDCHPCQFDEACYKLGQCREIPAASVAAFALNRLQGKNWQAGTLATDGCTALLSAKNSSGYHVLLPLAPADDRTRQMAWAGDFWRALLDCLDDPDCQGAEFQPPTDAWGVPLSPPSTAREEARLLGKCAQLFDALLKLGSKLRNPGNERMFISLTTQIMQLLQDGPAVCGLLGLFWADLWKLPPEKHGQELLRKIRVLGGFARQYAEALTGTNIA